ncbi:MAG: hypothetical protein ACKOPH_09180, partial [Methylocystis sp.]
IAVWVFGLTIFFTAIYLAAKSDKPGTRLAEILFLSSGWEGALLWGVIALVVGQADKWRDELDKDDLTNSRKSANIDENNTTEKGSDNDRDA